MADPATRAQSTPPGQHIKFSRQQNALPLAGGRTNHCGRQCSSRAERCKAHRAQGIADRRRSSVACRRHLFS